MGRGRVSDAMTLLVFLLFIIKFAYYYYYRIFYKMVQIV